MQFTIHIPKHPSQHIALLQAGRSALTTALLSHSHVFDMSRLSLLRFTLKKRAEVQSGPAKAHVEMTTNQESAAGQHYLIRADFDFGVAEFEIVDRKRGLRSNVLRELPQTQKSRNDLTLEICLGESRPLEDLVLEAMPPDPRPQITFHICGKYVL